jgi:Protein of unknown function (DUF3592)
MTVNRLQHPPNRRGLLVAVLLLLGLTAGLCTIFASVVTAAEAWVESAQAKWPEATASIEKCGLELYTHMPEAYWIDCSITYPVRGEEISSQVHSHSTPAPRRVVWQYPPQQFEKMQAWVDEHPEGTPMVVHYDPRNPRKAVLVTSDMPLAGPRTPANLKLLGFFAASCAVLFALARITRKRPAAVGADFRETGH